MRSSQRGELRGAHAGGADADAIVAGAPRGALRAGLLAACLVLMVALAGCTDRRDDIPFDAPAWLAAGRGDMNSRTTRGRMTEDLVNRVLRLGMPRGEVLAMLGAPDQPASTKEVVYYLGRGTSGVVPALAFLVLSFDGDRLVAVRIADD